MNAKDKLLKIISDLAKHDTTNIYYSLTLNYKDIVEYNYKQQFDFEKIKIVIDSFETKITSFNLTLKNETSYKDFDEIQNKYYNMFTLVFLYKGGYFSFASPFMSNQFYLHNKSVDTAIEILKTHIESSKKIYTLVKSKKVKNAKEI